MPEISRFFGIIIKIHWGDHKPPHFHVYYQGYKATYNIETGKKMSKRIFPKSADTIIKKWAGQHKEELLECWMLISKYQPFNQIKGADK